MSMSEFSSSGSKNTQKKSKKLFVQGNNLPSKKFFFNRPFWIGGLVTGLVLFFVIQSMINPEDLKTSFVPDQQVKVEQRQDAFAASPRDDSIDLSSSPITKLSHNSEALETKEKERTPLITKDNEDKNVLKIPSTVDNIQNHRPLENGDDHQSNTQDLESKIENLEQKLAILEKQEQQKSLIWYLFQSLQKALEGSQNFEQELQQYLEVTRQNAKIQENLNSLIPYAKSGLPSEEHLIHDFKTVKDQLVEILKQRLTGWRKINLYLMPWIQIYKIKNEEMILSSDLIQKLQNSVDLKDFDQILEILSQVKEEMPSILKEWQQQVLMYQQKTKRIQTLSDQTVFEIMHSTDSVRKSEL